MLYQELSLPLRHHGVNLHTQRFRRCKDFSNRLTQVFQVQCIHLMTIWKYFSFDLWFRVQSSVEVLQCLLYETIPLRPWLQPFYQAIRSNQQKHLDLNSRSHLKGKRFHLFCQYWNSSCQEHQLILARHNALYLQLFLPLCHLVK